MHLQYRFIYAVLAAKVKQYIATEFGLDVLPDWLVELRPMLCIKHDMRDYLILKEPEGLEWIAVVCNVVFEMGVMSSFFGLYWDERKVVLIDGGKIKWVATTLDTVALATVRAIEKEGEEKTRNRILLVQDFRTSQSEISAKVAEKTGKNGWTVEEVKYDQWLEEAKDAARKGDHIGLSKLTFGTVLLGSKWEEREEFVHGLLELPANQFDVAIGEVLKDVS
ncbi:uncharacterized protein A1O9_01706 [Exophiala aquamarina CBS 119918]|uniref:NmrA-like domain-containing protein n=1 Tax=Exophiala aquamarina CBS 119918 TaxID=1182545 RepID=A0A072PWJ5_9EURO|nr:uncharacterized protein A1O9_01706 [Exophiala aquamarina CBS 119918]KEF63728.1 hypothetical protein A1O9_01706 [Exophiala aquamarina CBS 119918]